MRKSLATLKLVLIGFALATSVVTQAQKKPGFIPPSIDDEEIPVVKTELPAPEKGKDYVVKYFKGITDGEESRIAVKNLGYNCQITGTGDYFKSKRYTLHED